MRTPLPLAARLYRTVLHLYPPVFQDAFADDMLQDFVDARADREGILLGLLTLIVLFLIGSTILITFWTNQVLRRRRRT